MRPAVIAVSGFDPSGGAGVLADIKTFENHGLTGLGAITANTVQTERIFNSVNWVEDSLLFNQLEVLLANYPVKGVKIGIVRNYDILKKVVELVRRYHPNAIIVWDPILKSSTGFEFGGDFDLEDLIGVDIIAPNRLEFEKLFGTWSENKCLKLTEKYGIYLKGGHGPELGVDLFYYKGKSWKFNPKLIGAPKHGSGCVLSSALLSNLVLDFGTIKTGLRSKKYVERYLSSSTNLTGYHS